ncbi:hypothetical protein DFS34DRAFT_36292 [Phlyctochytrium arcticum]|nr:hypothetical protein DFS34DRAFT_36292 [Phlyctochytrium arcticum]
MANSTVIPSERTNTSPRNTQSSVVVADTPNDTGTRGSQERWTANMELRSPDLSPPIELGGPINLSDGGEMGGRIRDFDWSNTSLGPSESWPNELRATLNVICASRFAFIVFWGPEHLIFYNDAYKQILGPKHPCLGRPAPIVWSDIWPEIGSEVARVRCGETSWNADRFLPMLRHGYQEETYFTWSMSPIKSDNGELMGILIPSFEVTERVIRERQERCVRELGGQAGAAKTVVEACRMAADCLQKDFADIPMSAIYLYEREGQRAVRQATTGGPFSYMALPETLDFNAEVHGSIPAAVRSVLTSTGTVAFALDDDCVISGTYWPERVTMALASPIRSSLGDPIGCIVMGRSSRRQLNTLYRNFHELVARQLSNNVATALSYEQEKRKREILAELDKAKTDFFSSVSHEFRTPLMLVGGPLEEALKKDLPPDVRADLSVVHRNSLRLLKLVNSLLDFSRLEAGRMQASYQATRLEQLIVDLCGVFRSAIERASLELVVDAKPIGELVYVDRDVMEKIVYNLLSNALKCTLKGAITVTLSREDDFAVLRVKDTGLGISKEYLPRIFERFFRVEVVGRRSNEGTGIGLALTQELVKLHEGKISVESEIDVGTTFTIHLPLGTHHLHRDRVSQSPAGGTQAILSPGLSSQYVEEAMGWLPHRDDEDQQEKTDHDQSARHIKERKAGDESKVNLFRWSATGADTFGSTTPEPYILVCDDNADMALYLKSLLSPLRVRIARDGAQALERIREKAPGLILSDVMMPRVDGFELVRQIRADPEHRLLPIILLSARAGEEARVEGLEVGADDYMAKPFGAKELVARVRTHLELGRLRNELEHLARLSPVGIFRANQQGDVVYRSQRLVQMSGAHIGMPLMSTVHKDDLVSVKAAWWTSIKDRESARIEFRYERPDGKTVWVIAQWAPEKDENGTLHGFVGAVTDITEQVVDQQRQLQEAEDNRKAQENLIDMISHEIRNPINAIYNNVDLLRTGLLERRILSDNFMARLASTDSPLYKDIYERTCQQMADDTEALNAIQSCAKHQRVIADDVLHLSKLKSGNISVCKSVFDPPAVVRSIASIYNAEMEAKNIQFRTHIDWKYSAVIGDPDRLGQILINVLSNAVKFTEKCTVREITLSLEGQVESRSEEAQIDTSLDVQPAQTILLVVSVKDTGIGMSKEAQDKLFKRFSQASIRTHREYGGTGLGLHISKQLAQLMNGDIVAQSAPGKGSTFTVTARCELSNDRSCVSSVDDALPTTKSNLYVAANAVEHASLSVASGAAIKTQQTGNISSRGKIRVLIVEDNLINQRVLHRQLVIGGFEPTVANNGQEALDLICAPQNPDHGGGLSTGMYGYDGFEVVLMDLEMPTMDGLTATLQIRKWEVQLLKERMERKEDHLPNSADGLTEGISISAPPNGLSGASSIVASLVPSGEPGEILRAADHTPTGAVSVVPLSNSPPMSIPSSYTASSHFLRLPIIGLSGNARTHHRERAIEAGMDDYVVKPYERTNLFERIRYWADRFFSSDETTAEDT